MATYDVADRSAIVTGAGSGIGRAIAALLAENGAAVLVADLDRGAAEVVTKEIVAAGGKAEAFVGDVADPEVAVAAVAAAEALAPLRIAVNNAGIGGANAPVGEYPIDSWRKVIDVNLNAVFYGMRAQIPAIAGNGGGAIVNMASVLGSVGIAGMQTGIYPAETPGGWQLIGRTPVKPFDPSRADPFLMKAGDAVQFYAIDRAEYDRARSTS